MANLCLFTWCILCIWWKHLLIWVWIIYRIDSRDMLVASDPCGLFSVVSHCPWTISHQTLCHLQHVRGAVNKSRHSYSDRHYLRLQAVPSFWQNPSCRSEKNQWKKLMLVHSTEMWVWCIWKEESSVLWADNNFFTDCLWFWQLTLQKRRECL